MVAEGLWGESNEQRERQRHDQKRLGETPPEQPRLAWTGPPQRRYCYAKLEDVLWLRRCSVERSLVQCSEQQYWKQLEYEQCCAEQC